jgi:hypothetical protein
MSANTAPVFSLVPHCTGVQFANADGTGVKTLFTPGANGSRIDGICISTTDTANENVEFSLYDGTTYRAIGNVPVLAGSGYGAVARTDALAVLAPATTHALVIQAGWTLCCAMATAVTATKLTDVVVLSAGDF